MAFAIGNTAIEILCDGLSDGVVVLRGGRVAIVNDGACELLATPRSFLLGAELEELLGRIGLPAPWLLRLRAGDPVTTVGDDGHNPALRLRWINLPADEQGELATIVIQDMRLGRALRESEDALALQSTSELGVAKMPLPANAVLGFLAHEVRRCHRDFEELSVMLGVARDPTHASAIASCIAPHLRDADRVGPCDPHERRAANDGSLTIVNLPRQASAHDHVLAVLPCTTAGGRDALAMRLASIVSAAGLGPVPMGVATLQVRTALRRPGDRPRDGARALLERAFGDLARQRCEPAASDVIWAA